MRSRSLAARYLQLAQGLQAAGDALIRARLAPAGAASMDDLCVLDRYVTMWRTTAPS